MDEQRFTKMVLAEMDSVYRLALYLSSVQEADDLVQETFVRAFRSLDTYKTSDHGMRPWLFKILHNVLFDHLSADQRRRAALEALRDEQGSQADEATDTALANDRIDWERVDGRLRSAIDGLPLHHKSIFLLWAIEGLRYREISAIAGVPIGTVMSRLCRARATLAAELSDVASEQRRMRPSDEPAEAANAYVNGASEPGGESNQGSTDVS